MVTFLETPKRLKLILNVLLLLISLYGAAKKDFIVDESTFFQRLVINTTAPMQQFVFNLRSSVLLFFRHYIFIVNASMENDQLTKKVHDLEYTIFQLGEIKRENERLKELLKFGEEIPREKVLAQVVGFDSSSEFKVLRINKGLRDGVVLKSTVVTGQGLVGYVYRVSDYFSDILTILDQNGRIDAIVTRTRSHGIVQGLSHSKCIMKYVTRTEPVEVGDELITAGLGNIYPKGLRIGSIASIEKESYGITQLIEINPSVNFRKLEEVIVLINK
ncbi:MAG: rod shape-determining protein MreC [Oligoflexia bacterium]|nr:rod shape-determining protein MreC [Oligoflexia bacterium]MBF0365988.1 rod shape-determining protein MreC [Oligoflexia bacterium]